MKQREHYRTNTGATRHQNAHRTCADLCMAKRGNTDGADITSLLRACMPHEVDATMCPLTSTTMECPSLSHRLTLGTICIISLETLRRCHAM